MATTKFDWRFLKRNRREIKEAHRKETKVWITKMQGMMARSVSLSAVSWEASFVNTTSIHQQTICHHYIVN